MSLQQILYSRGVTAEVTKGWWDSFRKRHPNLKLRQAEPLAYTRAMANDREVINKYFDMLEETIQENGLTNRPAQIFNCDETGLPLTHKPPKVVVRVGQKHPYTVTSNEKAQSQSLHVEMQLATAFLQWLFLTVRHSSLK